METGPEIWQALGIGKTRDRGAIRIAFTRRLEAMDMDADAVAYVALRLNYETALAWSRGLNLVGGWQDGAAGTGDPVWPREAAREEAWYAFDLPPRAEWMLPEAEELDRLFGTVAAEGRRWLTTNEKQELRRCWAVLAQDADGDTDRAMRWLIANWGPIAVGLVPFATEHFGWQQAPDDSAADGTIGEALWHYRGIQFLQRVRRPGHSHNEAWVELTTRTVPGAGRGRANPQRVHELQAVARHVWPETEAGFDPGRVAVWANNTADPAHPDNPRQEAQWLKTLGKIAVVLIVIRIGWFVLMSLLAMLGFVMSGP